ncbi:MAG: hypothetical protein JO165_11685 [Candidatus Eremiobacteraeota bacterium]|nr:hypothetical protein [Candidatus Eremiobacteraeota bacterium]
MIVGYVRCAALLVSAAVLGACGGGGGGSSLVTASQSGTNIVPPVSTDANITQLSATNGAISSSIRAGSHSAIIAVMSGAGDLAPAGNAFAEDSLALTTSASGSQSAMRFPHAALQQRTPVEAFPADDARTQALVRRMQPSVNAPARVRTQSFIAARVGTTSNIWVQKNSLGGNGGAYQSVPATLEIQTAHGNIWIDDSLVSGSGSSSSFSAGSLSATVAQIGNDFENAYASDTAHFASADYPASAPGLSPSYKACNADGSDAGSTKAYIGEPADGRINVMIVNPSSFGAGLGGYFSSVNYMPQVALNCLGGSYRSNEAPFIYVGWFQNTGSDYELKEDLVRATAHELQHLINFVNHGILTPGNAYEETFINEGLSMLAQDFAVQRLYGSSGVRFDADDAMSRASAYLNAPQNYSISAFTGVEDAQTSPQYNCGGGCYGSAYLFQRYLYDRFGGDAYSQAMERSGVVGAANIAAVSHSTLSQVLSDFALAMAANSAAVTPSDSRYVFGSLDLTGSYSDQFGNSRTLGGVALTPLSGTSVQVSAPVGGFAFVNVSKVAPGGQPFTVTDRDTASGFALVGGLVQH